MLDTEQWHLLTTLVEATRRLPQNQREQFAMMEIPGFANYLIRHPALKFGEAQAYPTDVSLLERAGYVLIEHLSTGSLVVDVTPQGFKAYADFQKSRGSPVARVETRIRRFIDDKTLTEVYPRAIAKWRMAEDLLWKDESPMHATAIGHHCREAMQEFASELLKRFPADGASEDPTKTVDRIRAVLLRRQRSKSVLTFTSALIAYWGEVSDLAQRQEHGATKEAEPLDWHDARRLVFQTLVVLSEIHDATAVAPEAQTTR